jgi:isoquinoline 1-oxidoreductase subunit beta
MLGIGFDPFGALAMKKRHFLFMGLGAVGALTVGWGVLPPRQRLNGVDLPLTKGQLALNAWLKLNPDGTVALACPKSEMGQGVHTALAMLVAEELDLPLSAVRLEQSPIDRLYGNVAGLAEGVPFRPDDEGLLPRTARWTMLKVMRELGIMMTGGSSSVSDLWLPLREAAAMTRASLVNTVAAHWGVSAASIQLAQGVFSSGNQRMALGEVVTKLAAQIKPASQYQVKASSAFKLLGQATPRPDSAAKVDGSAVFGMDALRPTHYAALRFNPVRGGEAPSKEQLAALSTAAKASAGVKQVLSFPANIVGSGNTGGIAVVAAHYWPAKKAAEALQADWGKAAAELATLSSASVQQSLRTALNENNGFTYYKTGQALDELAKAHQAPSSSQAKPIKAQYSAPYLAHATLEPMNATVELSGQGKERRAVISVGTQVPDLAQRAAAKVLGLSAEQVQIKLPYLGGGFGRRLEVDVIAIAAQLAAQVFGADQSGTLQVIWSREADTQHDFYRPAALANFEAALDAQGQIKAWVNHAASQHIVPQYMPRNAGLPLAGPDKTSIEGAFDQAYEFAHAHVSHTAVNLPVPVGFWRSVGHSHQAFFKESFLDECVHAATQAGHSSDPLAYRLALLKQHPRHAAVLQLAASKAGWGRLSKRAPGSTPTAQGLALHESFGSIVALVAEVSVNANQIRVHKVTVAVDCGIGVNPNGLAQQVESSVIFGLSAALYGKIDFKEGQVQQSNFHDYPALRMGDSPAIETHIIPSTRAPSGMGEPALPPVAPAVANALFALTGKRLRALPLSLTA